ncbi:PLP-dependent transferase [Streptomyces anthocyanicus]|uniref:PLP-dependent transferase n=1 Tax=Streptomyces anthocyanicus TaxID=68174 RepID=UPI00386819DB
MPPREASGPLVPPLGLATAHHQDLEDIALTRYGRWEHDSAANLEEALGALDGGTAVAFNSGMSAISSVMMTLLRPGDILVVGADTYYETRQIADQPATAVCSSAPSPTCPGSSPKRWPVPGWCCSNRRPIRSWTSTTCGSAPA